MNFSADFNAMQGSNGSGVTHGAAQRHCFGNEGELRQQQRGHDPRWLSAAHAVGDGGEPDLCQLADQDVRREPHCAR